MKQIKNPEYIKWARELRKWAMCNDFYWEERIDEHTGRLHPFSVPQMLRLQDNEKVRSWFELNPMPAKTIDDPEYVAMQQRITELEERCNNLEHGKDIDISKLLREWHEHRDALSIEDVQFVVDKLLLHMRINDTLNIMWSVSKEDEHFYTDKGLEVPFSFLGSDDEYHMSMLSVYIDSFLVSRNKTREQRYYECLQADIDKKLKEKEC